MDDGGRADVQEAVGGGHDGGEQGREDQAGQQRMGIGLQELGRRGIDPRKFGMAARQHQSSHGQADGQPEERGQRIPHHRDGQSAPHILHPLAHHQLGDHVRLARGAQGKEEIPGEAPQHSHRSPRTDGFGVVGPNGQ